ncbi:MAG: methyltransferase domain-containing protein, partial [Rhodospirillales bacterium]
MSDPMQVFNRRLKRQHRDRAAPRFAEHAFLKEEAAERLLDRLDDLNRTFADVLDLGCHTGEVGCLLRTRPGVERLIQCDLSAAMAGQATRNGGLTAVADEEFLPFRPGAFDLIVSCLSLHWVNDLPGTLAQIRACLKPDGLFLALILGGETLKELREVMAEAEIEREGGLSPRVSPFADVRDAGALLQRAGFALPVVDAETVTVSYPQAFKLMGDLRGMGEANAVLARRNTPTRRATLLRAVELYSERFGDDDGRIPASFQFVALTGWAPDASQQKPLRPG